MDFYITFDFCSFLRRAPWIIHGHLEWKNCYLPEIGKWISCRCLLFLSEARQEFFKSISFEIWIEGENMWRHKEIVSLRRTTPRNFLNFIPGQFTPKARENEWKKIIKNYLMKRENVILVFMGPATVRHSNREQEIPTEKCWIPIEFLMDVSSFSLALLGFCTVGI